MKNDWKDNLNSIKNEVPKVEETPLSIVVKPAKKLQVEPLRVELDKRKGKLATLVTDYQGKDEELKELAKMLKIKCGTGGSSRDGEILIQGDFRVKIAEILLGIGYKVKRINFK